MLLVKRPLVCCGVSCIIGCFAGKWLYHIFGFQEVLFLSYGDIACLLVCSFLILISACFFLIAEKISFVSNHTGKRYQLLLFFISLLFLCSMFRFYLHSLPTSLEKIAGQKIEGSLCGTAYHVQDTEKGKRIYLKKIVFHSSGSGKCSDSIVCDNLGIIKGKVLLYDSSGKEVKPGNVILVKTTLQNFRKATNPGQYDEYKYQKSHGLDVMAYSEELVILDDKTDWLACTLQGVKNRVAKIYDKILGEKEASVIKAMVLGEKSGLDREIKNLYSENGIAHILAISGLHISMVGMIIYQILKWVLLRIAWEKMVPMVSVKLSVFLTEFLSSVSAVLLIILYGKMTGFGVSTNRAVVMFLLSLLAGLVGRTYDLATGMSLAVLIILFREPLYLYDSGFLLSFGAIFGIVILLPVLEMFFADVDREKKRSRRKKEISTMEKLCSVIRGRIRAGFLVSMAIFVITFPIVIKTYFSYPLYGIFLNLLIIPLMSVLLPTAVFMGILGIFSTELAAVPAIFVTWILKFYETICVITGELPGAIQLTGSPSVQKIVFYCAVLGIVLLTGYWKKYHHYGSIATFPLFCAVLIGCMYRQPPSGLKVTFLDVGQGDSIVMELPGGGAVTVDGGSSDVSGVGEYRMAPFLKSERVSKVECAFLTHMDADHINAIRELLEMERGNGRGIFIINLAVPAVLKENENWREIKELAKEKGTGILYLRAGDEFEIQGVRFQCMHPSEEFIDASENAASLVMKIDYKEFDLLLTGDVEGKGEMELLENWREELNQTDVLKVAHHGSRNSTSEEFLQECQPEISIISCGEGNRYGHPHQELMERLHERKSEILTTEESGAIIINTDGLKMEVRKYNSGSSLNFLLDGE